MDQDQNQKSDEVENKEKSLDPRIAKLEAHRAVKRISNKDSPWNLTQELFQEIQAGHIVANPEKQPHLTELVKELKSEIEVRYHEEPEMLKLLLDSVPDVRSVRVWVKKEGWDEAVWKKIRGDKLFSPEKRSEVILALHRRAINSSDQAAKIYLTLSGDYSEKMEVDNKSADIYREINQVLHKKKE